MEGMKKKPQHSNTPSLHHCIPQVLGVIPARWGSTRFPGKALAPIAGKPLIQWVVERARQARRLGELIVATDDERIGKVVEGLGVRAVRTRPDHPSGTDRVAEAVSGMRCEVVVNIQGDEPLISPELIDELASVLLEDTSWDMATAATPIVSAADAANPSVVKVVRALDGQALYFSRAVIPHVREKAAGTPGMDRLYWRHIGIYAYRRPCLERLVATEPCALERAEKLEQLRALYLGCRMKVVETADAGVGVDTPEDVAKAEAALKRAGLF